MAERDCLDGVRDTESKTGNRIYGWAILAIVLGSLIALAIGTVSIDPVKIVKIMLHRIPALAPYIAPDWSLAEEAIIWQIRMPRIVLGLLVGAELSAAGVIYQGIFRNPMADPYVIGASSGASLGATLAILLFSGIKVLGIGSVPAFAFIGAAATIFLVYTIANSAAGRTPLLCCFPVSP